MPLYRSISIGGGYVGQSVAYLVTFINELMSTSNELEAIDVVELRSDLVAKQPSCAPRGYSPGSNVFGIAPDEVAESTFVGDLLRSSNDAYLVQGPDLRTQTAVDAEHFAVNDCTED